MDFQQYSVKCETHAKEIMFICCQNEWHCEGLCQDCIPEHTLQHQKNNSKFNLKNVDQSIQESQKILSEMSIQYNNTQEDLQQKIDLQHIVDDENLMNLRKWKKDLYQKIDERFLEIEQWYRQIYQQLESQKSQKLKEINENLQNEQQNIMDNLLKLSQQALVQQNINEFLSPLKYALTKNIEKKLESQQKQIYSISEQKIEYQLSLNESILDSMLQNIGKLVDRKELQKQQQIEKDKEQGKVTKKPIKVPKKPKCPECQSEMVYLSELKKHMTCPNCQGVKRNYTSKNVSNVGKKNSLGGGRKF